MIKRLLGSTALLGALVMVGEANAAAQAASPALATPKLTISGQSSFNAWWFNNRRKTIEVEDLEIGLFEADPSPCDVKGKGRGYLFTVDDSRLKFDITGKTDPGMDYGFTIVIDGNTEKTSHDKTIKENYLYMGGSWGRLTLGDHDGVEDTMAFYGGDALGGTGGFDGNFDRVVNFTTGAVRSSDLVGETSKSTKATYQTPRWKGIQLGVSYTPRVEHRGEGKTDTLRSIKSPRQPYDTHSFAGGVNFINKFNNGWELALSGTFIFGEAHAPCSRQQDFVAEDVDGTGINVLISNKYENTRAFALGFLNSYKGFEWGGEFGWNGDSHEVKKIRVSNGTDYISSSPKDSWFIDTGLGYTWGATKISAGYFYGQRKAVRLELTNTGARLGRKTAKTHIFSASLDHKLAPGVVVFTEYAHYNMNNKGADVDAAVRAAADSGVDFAPVRSNRANAFVVGTKIKF